MPKNLIVVGQRGAGIIDQNDVSSNNIRGFYTTDIESCLVMYVTGNHGQRHALLHIDRQTSKDSIESFFQDNFSQIDDYKLFFNPIVSKEGIARDIFRENIKKIRGVLPHKLDKTKYFATHKEDEDGSVLINIDLDGATSFNVKNDIADLQSRSVYDKNAEEVRKEINFINGFFGDQLALDLQYLNSNYTDLPQIANSELSKDLKLFDHIDEEKIYSWVTSRETMRKYPDSALKILQHPQFVPFLVINIADYLSYQRENPQAECKANISSDIYQQEKNTKNSSPTAIIIPTSVSEARSLSAQTQK